MVERGRGAWGMWLVAAASITLLSSRPAHATEFEVTGDTALQAYEVASPWGDVVLQRRRFTQTLGLGVYNLQGQPHVGQADYRVVLMMRLDTDFGLATGETTYANPPNAPGARYIPGLDPAPVDIMFGYVEGRNLANGLLGFRIGRQYVTDVLGWWSFDGALLRMTTPYYVSAEVYGGLEQRGGLPLSSSRYESQGVWRGSHADFNNGSGPSSVTDYPSFQYAEPAPAFGFALETNGPSFVHSRLSYRRVYNTGTALTTQFPDPNGGGYHAVDGTRISSERIGYAADASKPDLGGVKGGFSYDLYNQLVATAYGGLEAHLGKHVTVGADVDYFVPTFDADSIWNWFTHGPITTATARTTVRIGKRFDMSVSGGARVWSVEGDPSPAGQTGLSIFGAGECAAVRAQASTVVCSSGKGYYDPANPQASAYASSQAARAATLTPDALGNLAARYRFGSGNVGLRGMVEAGGRGSREGADIDGEKRFDGGRYSAGGHVSVYGWADPTRPDRDAVSFSYTLAGGFKPTSVAAFKLEFEHDMNRLVGQRFRVVGLVNVLVLK